MAMEDRRRSETLRCVDIIQYIIDNTKANSSQGDVVRIAPNELVFLTPQAARGALSVQVFGYWANVDTVSRYLPSA